MRLLLQHKSRYEYPRPAALGPQIIRLRPATHAKATIETYTLRVDPPCTLHWQQDPSGNRIARATFEGGKRVDHFEVHVEIAVDIRPVNPFDFYIDDRADKVPFEYPTEMQPDLAPFLGSAAADENAPLLRAFLEELPHGGKTVPFIVELNRLVNARIKYVIREEAGLWTPEETLAAGRGSCRDSAVLLVAVLRSRGLAARFVSGYLIQLTDEGMIPNQPRGVGHDVADLHAWAEVFLPGGGWVGLDATSGLLCGEGHIPLACTAFPPFASPLEGSSDVPATHVSFEMKIGRLGHEPRPTAPYEQDVWEALLAGADRADEHLVAQGLTLTMGGEPTFNSREHAALAEWNTGALGATKWAHGLELTRELRQRLAPGAAVIVCSGKQYPGESLPRWALEICGRRDGQTLWRDFKPDLRLDASVPSAEKARAIAEAIAQRLGLARYLMPAFEDPWHFVQEEASVPTDVDPLKANLDDSEERHRLARVLDRGLRREAGYVLPVLRDHGEWVSEHWSLRRGHLFVVPGDSSIGLRLPLKALSKADPPVPLEEEVSPPDPRTAPDDEETAAQRRVRFNASLDVDDAPPLPTKPAPKKPPVRVRTALTVEARKGAIYVFLPPLTKAEDFFDLLAAIDAARAEAGVDVLLEGYPPPSSPLLYRFAVTPDPGVLEVNLPPVATTREYATLMETVFDAALHSGLHSEKYTLDGRQAGSGGGNHLTFGGPTALASPFLKRPDLLASLITFLQHHPSISYMFTGLFVGPTSQAPRIDEARHDSVYEMEIALERAFSAQFDAPPPWLVDMLFRHLLVDVSGNTHRAEICIDKLFSPDGPAGRHGLVELRAFEMPPHFRMAIAEGILVRNLLAAFADQPYQHPLCRFGQSLHDRYLLPYWLWRDFEDVLAFLDARGLGLPAAAYRPFIDMRCPVAGELFAGDVRLEVRNAMEPWNVLGEEMSTSGTSRYVDSSVERIEVLADGLVPERHAVLVNGHLLPLRPTGTAGRYVGGVRFRAWAPPHSLQPHLGIHHPLRLDVLDLWGKRSIGACAYHVWDPGGCGYNTAPLTRFEAAARRAQRFTTVGATPWPVEPIATTPHPDRPYTLDLRRYAGDKPPPPRVAEAVEGVK